MSHAPFNKPPRAVLQRREFFKQALLGAAGIGAFSFLKKGGIPGLSDLLARVTGAMPGLGALHASEILADALNFGPSLYFVSQALAAENDGPAVFRVFYGISHDIRNELHLIDHGPQYNPFRALNYGPMTNALQTKAQKAPDPHSIMNLWAYQLLTTGKIDGQTPLAAGLEAPPLSSEEIQKISIIAAVGMGGSQGIHQRASIPQVGTLEYATLQAYPGYSPIGSVSLNAQMVDQTGGVSSPGTTVAGFVNSIDIPATYMSRSQDENPVRVLDQLTGDKQVAQVRNQMLDAHNLLIAQLANIQRYVGVAGTTFNTYGQRQLEGLAAMMMFADLFKQGLATVGASGMNSFDFHATDALRAPAQGMGNMLTETAQALAGTFFIARAAFEAKRDAIVHFTTCSNRNENWVNDDGHVSTITFIIKGKDNSPYANVPLQSALLPGNMAQVYAEGPGNGTANYSGPDAQALGLTGNVTVGRVESTIVKSVGQATNKSPQHRTEDPPGKLI